MTYYVSSGTLNHAHSVRTQSEQPAVTRTDPGRKKSVVSSGLCVEVFLRGLLLRALSHPSPTACNAEWSGDALVHTYVGRDVVQWRNGKLLRQNISAICSRCSFMTSRHSLLGRVKFQQRRRDKPILAFCDSRPSIQ